MIRTVQARDARKRFREMAPVLNEQSLRRFVAMEARALGRGGVSLMSRISGLARSTIYHGLFDVRNIVATTLGQPAPCWGANVYAPMGRVSRLTNDGRDVAKRLEDRCAVILHRI